MDEHKCTRCEKEWGTTCIFDLFENWPFAYKRIRFCKTCYAIIVGNNSLSLKNICNCVLGDYHKKNGFIKVYCFSGMINESMCMECAKKLLGSYWYEKLLNSPEIATK